MTLPPEQPRRRSFWLWQTKRMFPNRIAAGCACAVCIFAGFLWIVVAVDIVGSWPMALPSILFFVGAIATFCAAVTESNSEFVKNSSNNRQPEKPTFAIMILLIGIYSWMLSLAMYFFGAFFDGLTPTKYYLTIGIAISSSLFMQFYGKQVIRKHFGNRGGRNLEISSGQAAAVILLLIGCGVYFVWLTV